MAHARLSPSARYRWGACPASPRVCAGYERKSSPAALDGTRTHALLEHCVKHGTDPLTTIGMPMMDLDGDFTIDADRAGRVKLAWDYAMSRGGVVLSEAHVNPELLVGRDDMSGTVDLHVVTPTMLEVIDYKDGVNQVSAEYNEQLEQYTAGILAKRVAAGLSNEFETIRMTIIQPKVALFGANPVSSFDISMDEFLSECVPIMVAQAAATDAPDAPFVPGEKQCTYCPHRGNCTAATADALGRAGIKFDGSDIVAQVTAIDATVSDDQLRDLVEAAPMIRKMLETAEATALERIKSGHPVAGLKVVRGNGRRKWALPDEDTAAKLTRMGVPKSKVWKLALITPAQTDKLEWHKRDGSTNTLSARQRKVLETELITKSDGALTVVPESDRRTAVEFTNVEAMFALPNWLT